MAGQAEVELHLLGGSQRATMQEKAPVFGVFFLGAKQKGGRTQCLEAWSRRMWLPASENGTMVTYGNLPHCGIGMVTYHMGASKYLAAWAPLNGTLPHPGVGCVCERDAIASLKRQRLCMFTKKADAPLVQDVREADALVQAMRPSLVECACSGQCGIFEPYCVTDRMNGHGVDKWSSNHDSVWFFLN